MKIEKYLWKSKGKSIFVRKTILKIRFLLTIKLK